MIKKLYIIAESSANLFTYAPLETKMDDIQDQLITGFITANVSFSEAVIGQDLNTIRVGEERLIFFKDENSKLIVAAIADTRDHVKLLYKVMNEILANFKSLFKKELGLRNVDFSKSDKARDFKYFIDDLCEKYIFSRAKWKTFLAIAVGAVISSLLSLVFLNPSSELFNNLINIINAGGGLVMDIRAFGLICFLIQLILFTVLAPGSFSAGLLAADRKNGKIASIIHYVVVLIVESIYYGFVSTMFYNVINPNIIIFYIYILLVFLPSIFLVLFYIGDLGGFILTRIRLYPLEELKMKDHDYLGLKRDIY
jgi:hypothetical protein